MPITPERLAVIRRLKAKCKAAREAQREEERRLRELYPKDETYFFHQTPAALCVDLLKFVPLKPNDTVIEPFAGENAFYDNFPEFVVKERAEITEGVDFRSIDYEAKSFDWVVSNPPFRLQDEGAKAKNAFFDLLVFFAEKVNKGIFFLGSDQCLGTLTPKRVKELNELGLYLCFLTHAHV